MLLLIAVRVKLNHAVVRPITDYFLLELRVDAPVLLSGSRAVFPHYYRVRSRIVGERISLRLSPFSCATDPDRECRVGRGGYQLRVTHLQEDALPLALLYRTVLLLHVVLLGAFVHLVIGDRVSNATVHVLS